MRSEPCCGAEASCGPNPAASRILLPASPTASPSPRAVELRVAAAAAWLSTADDDAVLAIRTRCAILVHTFARYAVDGTEER